MVAKIWKTIQKLETVPSFQSDETNNNSLTEINRANAPQQKTQMYVQKLSGVPLDHAKTDTDVDALATHMKCRKKNKTRTAKTL